MINLGKKDSEKNRRALHAALVQSTLIVATTEPFDPNGPDPAAKKSAKKKVAKKSKKKSKAKKKNEQTAESGGFYLKKEREQSTGDWVLSVFTDQQAFTAWNEGVTHFVALPARDIFQLVLENDLDKIAINPAGPIWGTLLKSDIQRLLFAGDG